MPKHTTHKGESLKSSLSTIDSTGHFIQPFSSEVASSPSNLWSAASRLGSWLSSIAGDTSSSYRPCALIGQAFFSGSNLNCFFVDLLVNSTASYAVKAVRDIVE
jgi:hypothetical protein